MPSQQQQEVFQQIDIMPTVLDWVGYDKPYFSFGSPLSDSLNRRAVYGENSFQIIKNEYILFFNGTKTKGFYNYKNDPELKTNILKLSETKHLEVENELKAFRQLYNNRVIYNNMK